MDIVAPFKDAEEMIKEAGGEQYDLCFQCGLCTASCPWNRVRSFNPHKMMRQAQFGLVDLEDEGCWLCTTCNLCISRCPREVPITGVMQAARSIFMEYQYNMVAASLRSAMGSLTGEGNPWGGKRENRTDWATDMNVESYGKEHNLLYFPGCVPAYDPSLGSIARATAVILEKSGANFGILGTRESCCGESVRKAGNKDLFEQLATRNIEAFKESGVTEIVVNSPHCYTTFKEDYPGLGGNFDVIHLTQYLSRKIDQGELSLSKEINKRIVYHDPCYLGRHSNIYDEPRKVLQSIPGVELLDEVDSRENSLCCGGGGGRIWMETRKGERFSDILVEQAIELGADVLVTACPYCILNFKDSVQNEDKGDVLEIKDISEIVQEAMERP
ncbi:MAG: (Fe-S)-binding protein [Deltaproteobacteria bacterium]|nr:(Fe-S)-binding protein [Deltaproteobacteria bacterium]